MSDSGNKQNYIVVLVVVLMMIAAGAYFYFAPQVDVADNTSEEENTMATDKEALEEESGDVVDGVDDEHVVSEEIQWDTYTSDKWKFSFEYPSSYTLTEELEGVKIIVSPPEGEFDGPSDWFMVWVVQYPSDELLGDRDINEYLFNRANLPNGDVAWLKQEEFFPYENYFVGKEEISFGSSEEINALKVRETSINPDFGEYRSTVYVFREPIIYRVTHDLLAEEAYGDILQKVENSFTVLP